MPHGWSRDPKSYELCGVSYSLLGSMKKECIVASPLIKEGELRICAKAMQNGQIWHPRCYAFCRPKVDATTRAGFDKLSAADQALARGYAAERDSGASDKKKSSKFFWATHEADYEASKKQEPAALTALLAEAEKATQAKYGIKTDSESIEYKRAERLEKKAKNAVSHFKRQAYRDLVFAADAKVKGVAAASGKAVKKSSKVKTTGIKAKKGGPKASKQAVAAGAGALKKKKMNSTTTSAASASSGVVAVGGGKDKILFSKERFEVEKVLEARDGKVLVKWAGFNASENSWEPLTLDQRNTSAYLAFLAKKTKAKKAKQSTSNKFKTAATKAKVKKVIK